MNIYRSTLFSVFCSETTSLLTLSCLFCFVCVKPPPCLSDSWTSSLLSGFVVDAQVCSPLSHSVNPSLPALYYCHSDVPGQTPKPVFRDGRSSQPCCCCWTSDWSVCVRWAEQRVLSSRGRGAADWSFLVRLFSSLVYVTGSVVEMCFQTNYLIYSNT